MDTQHTGGADMTDIEELMRTLTFGESLSIDRVDCGWVVTYEYRGKLDGSIPTITKAEGIDIKHYSVFYGRPLSEAIKKTQRLVREELSKYTSGTGGDAGQNKL